MFYVDWISGRILGVIHFRWIGDFLLQFEIYIFLAICNKDNLEIAFYPFMKW